MWRHERVRQATATVWTCEGGETRPDTGTDWIAEWVVESEEGDVRGVRDVVDCVDVLREEICRDTEAGYAT